MDSSENILFKQYSASELISLIINTKSREEIKYIISNLISVLAQDKIIDAIISVSNTYDFVFLDNDYTMNLLKLEYVGDDIVLMDESDFDDKFSYEDFCNSQGDIVLTHFKQLLKKLTECGIVVYDYDCDESDYPCVFLKFKI